MRDSGTQKMTRVVGTIQLKYTTMLSVRGGVRVQQDGRTHSSK